MDKSLPPCDVPASAFQTRTLTYIHEASGCIQATPLYHPASIWICSSHRIKGIKRFFHWELFHFSFCLQSRMKNTQLYNIVLFDDLYFHAVFAFSLCTGSSPTVDLPDGRSGSCPAPLQSSFPPLWRDLHAHWGSAQESCGRVGSWFWEKCKLIENINECSFMGN